MHWEKDYQHFEPDEKGDILEKTRHFQEYPFFLWPSVKQVLGYPSVQPYYLEPNNKANFSQPNYEDYEIRNTFVLRQVFLT